MRTTKGAAVFAILVGLTACGSDSTNEGSSTTPDGGQSDSGGAAGAGASGGAAGLGGTSGAGGIGGMSGTGASGGEGGVGGAGGECQSNADCEPLLPATVPAGCAEATCDLVEGECRFKAIDADNDGHATNLCNPVGSTAPIELGADCDDGDPDTSPDGWDGPEGEGHPNHCDDGVDQDCSGMENDSVLTDGGTCVCTPGDVTACGKDSGGHDITYPGGTPQGECRYGSRTCLDSGQWGPCTDAKGPTTEVCNGLDDDCDGEEDDSAVGVETWYLDADDDGHGDKTQSGVVQCFAPGPMWKTAIVSDDCNDLDSEVHPGAWDGPAVQPTAYGLTAAGFAAEFYSCLDATQCLDDPTNLLVTGTDYAIDYLFQQGSPAVGVPGDYFAARWTGTLITDTAGTYTFHARTDDGVRVYVDGQLIIDSWVPQGPTWHAGTIDLPAATQVPIVYEMYERLGGAVAQLHWTLPGAADQQVLRVLSTPNPSGPYPDRCGDGKDNDCSNAVDDGSVVDGPLFRTCQSCAVGTAAVCGPPKLGICSPGVMKCKADGQWATGQCAGSIEPETEVCNGLDSDCDGFVDNKNPPCGCIGGQEESCGPCGDGTRTCSAQGQWGNCIGASSLQEYCQNADGDDYCDLSDCQSACAGSLGTTWKLKLTTCQSTTDCDDGDIAIHPSATETCDGVDNNCNNQVDENLVGPVCVVAHGTPCESTGNLLCIDGNFSQCNAVPGPSHPETCDNTDEDCDGLVDDGLYYGNSSYPGAACFVCKTMYTATTYMNTSLAGDTDFGTNGPMVYGKLEFSPLANGKLRVNSCVLMRETNGGASVAADCDTKDLTVLANGSVVPVVEVIGPVQMTGGYTYDADHKNYFPVYTDDDVHSTGQWDDSGTLTFPSMITFKKLDYQCRGQMFGEDVGYSNMAGCVFQSSGSEDCVTVRYPPP
jgi:PA14 domain/Putative metal-binding motif